MRGSSDVPCTYIARLHDTCTNTRTMTITVVSHPLLDARAFVTTLPTALDAITSPDGLHALLRPDAVAPVARSEEIRGAVRSMLRHGGYKPTGRGKPASEYLVRAAEENTLGSINAAVDICNAVSLASGLPISLVDLDRAREPLGIDVAPEGTSYVFNASGQQIDLGGLVCLFDAEGPCANAVKDAQRTKTHAGTTRTLTVIWGVRLFTEHGAAAERWYRELLHQLGAVTEDAVPAG